MTVPSLGTISAQRRIADRDYRVLGGGVRMRAQCRHVGTVVTISGDVDAANVDRVGDFATRVVRIGNAVILDLSGVGVFVEQAVSVLIDVDDACRGAAVAWVLIPSATVSRALQLTDDDTDVRTASGVTAALRQLTELTRVRRRRALMSMTV